MEIAKFLTNETLLTNLQNFNKYILNKIYYKKEKGEELEKKISKIIGNDDNISIRGLIKQLKKISKIFLKENEKLPDVNDDSVDTDSLYIYKDKNAIDEKCAYYLYTPKENSEGIKKWACISAPSNVYETVNIDFVKAFNRAKNKFTKKAAFTSYINLVNYLIENNKTILYDGYKCFSDDFLTHDKDNNQDFKACCVLYNKEKNFLYYFETSLNNIEPFTICKSENTFKLDLVDEQFLANKKALTIQNPKGGLANGSNQ